MKAEKFKISNLIKKGLVVHKGKESVMLGFT